MNGPRSHRSLYYHAQGMSDTYLERCQLRGCFVVPSWQWPKHPAVQQPTSTPRAACTKPIFNIAFALSCQCQFRSLREPDRGILCVSVPETLPVCTWLTSNLTTQNKFQPNSFSGRGREPAPLFQDLLFHATPPSIPACSIRLFAGIQCEDSQWARNDLRLLTGVLVRDRWL